MTTATIESIDAGSWQLAGSLDFESVPVLWKKLRDIIAKESNVSLSLAEVTSANSAAMVMLLEAKQVAKKANVSLVIEQIPEELMALFRLSNAEHLVAAEHD